MNKFQDIGSVVDTDLQFLSAMGYVLTSKESTDSKVLGQGLKWVYSAKKIDRKITLHYQPASKSGPECFSVFISATGHQNYILEELFRQQNKSDLTKLFYNFDKNVNSVEFCYDFLNNFKWLVEGEIFSIVSGAEWVDVQIDWSPYR